MIKRFALALAGLAFCCPALAAGDDPKWFYEFELNYGLPGYLDRLLEPSCGSVVPLPYVKLYAQDPRAGWTIACGNRQPMFFGALGRKCGELGPVKFECLWRHMSSPNDKHEITFDGIGLRGRFEFGGRRE